MTLNYRHLRNSVKQAAQENDYIKYITLFISFVPKISLYKCKESVFCFFFLVALLYNMNHINELNEDNEAENDIYALTV